MLRFIFACLLTLTSFCTHALTLDQISNQDAVGGLREALQKGADQAVGKLGKTDGFFGNPKVKIPLPDSLQKVDGVLRSFGMGKYSDELVLTMNRAAEAAVPEAKTLLINAIKSMSVQDAKGILSGGDTAATEFFRRTTSQPLRAKFLPIVKQATSKVKLTDKYDQFAGQASKMGLIDEKDANLENYIAQKALDGLFLMMAEEEKAIRADPIGQTGKLLSKVFGAIGR